MMSAEKIKRLANAINLSFSTAERERAISELNEAADAFEQKLTAEREAREKAEAERDEYLCITAECRDAAGDCHDHPEAMGNPHEVPAVVRRLKQRAESAEQRIREAMEQEPVCWRREWDGDESDLGNYVHADSKEELDKEGIWQPLYAAPIPPADVAELQKRVKYLELDKQSLNSTAEQYLADRTEAYQKIAELTRKLGEYEIELGILTIDRAKELFSYDSQSGVLTWNVNRGTARVGDQITHANCKGYINVKLGHRSYQAHRIIWMIFYGENPDGEIDHINRDKQDNRIDNLRCVTHSENMLNSGRKYKNKSGHVGVYQVKGKWSAQIRVSGKAINLGTFDDFDSAVLARKQGEEKYLNAAIRANKG